MTTKPSPYYRRNHMDADAQRRADAVVDAVRRHDAHLPEGTSDADWTVIADHPELFWATGTLMSINDGPHSIEYYDLSEEEIAQEQDEVERATRAILELAPEHGSEWDKALYAYETLVRLVSYREDEEGLAQAGMRDGIWHNGRDVSRTLYGPLVKHWGVCAGYAEALQYLLQRLGIECLRVSNGVRGKGHAWNLVRLDGAYCFVDATFGRSWSEGEDGTPAYLCHDYFGFSQEELLQVDAYRMLPTIPWPDRIAHDCDWYRRTGWYVEGFDAGRLDGLVSRARAEGLRVLEVKCADGMVQRITKRYLEEECGLSCCPHRFNVLAVPLVEGLALTCFGRDGAVVRPGGQTS